MARLRQSDLLAVLRLAHELNDAEDFDSFSTHAARGLQKLIPSESTTCVEVDGRRRRITGTQDPIDVAPSAEENQTYWAYRHQNPVAHQRRRVGDTSALKISDFLSQRQFHRLELHDGFFRPQGIEYQVSVGLARASSRTIVAGCNRASRDFSERDRHVLNLLHPHLVQGYRNVAVRARAALLLAGLERALEGGSKGYVLLGSNGDIEAASAAALQFLKRYFGARELPAAVGSWIRNPRGRSGKNGLPAPNSLELERDGTRLRITVSTANGAPDTLLLLEELPSLGPSAPPLPPRGLTPRESEVMTWVARGKTNREIGNALFVSPRTVQKHLEHIFEKLGVRTRTEAVAVAFGRPSFLD
jgi:DNA-binding CsgD family transcriptional regulator